MESAAVHARKVRQLSELVRELAGFEFPVTMSDAGPSLIIYGAGRRPALEVTVRGEHFEWRHDDDRHAATDPGGAASAIAAYVWKRSSEGVPRRPGSLGGSS